MAAINVKISLTDKVSNRLNTMNNKLNKVVKGFKSVNTSVNQLNTTVTKSVTSTDRLRRALTNTSKVSLRPVKKQVDNIDKSLRTAGKSTNWLGSKLKWLASVYLGVMGGKAIVGASDSVTSAMNMFRYAGMEQGLDKISAEAMGQDALDKIFSAAQRARSSYSEMISNVGKGMVLAPDAFGNNFDNAIAFQEIMAKTYKMGNKSAAEQASSMYQLMQALGSGILQGDELRSVNEGATMAYKIIERFAQGIYNSTDSLKDMASQGKITSDIVVAAILDAEQEVNAAFANTNATFSDMWQMFKDNTQKAFEPFLTKLNEIANSPAGQFIGEKLTSAIWALGNAFTWVATQVETAVNWIADNWTWLGGTIQNVGAIVTVVLAGLAIAWAFVNWQIILTVGAVLAVAYYLNEFGITANEILGYVAGAVLWLGAVIWDVLVTAVMWVVQAFIVLSNIVGLVATFAVQLILWIVTAVDSLILIVLNLIHTIVAGFTGAVKSAIIGVYQLFVSLGNGVLGVLEMIAMGIDAVFGSNLASTVRGWMDGLDQSVVTLESKLDPQGDFDSIGKQWKETTDYLGQRWRGEGQYDNWNLLDTMENQYLSGNRQVVAVEDFANGLMFDPEAAWNTGFNFGSNIGSGLSDMFNSDNILKKSTEGVKISGMDDMLDNLGNIAGDTGDISKAVSISEEDLKYLRQLAEAEAVNRFTTAEIKVDMTNHNTVNGNNDLDGIVTYLTESVREALEVAAEGVHA